jgi:L-lactate dehydrogenase complex protein LldF
MAARLLKLIGGDKGHIASLPFAGGWTKTRDLPAPEGETFFARYARTQRDSA